ncbi:hypothetical protein Trydic_g15433 [Trypoxylus dichotomus]
MLSIKVLYLLSIVSCIGSVKLDKATCEELGLEVFERGVSDNDVQIIVDRHNFYRQTVLAGKVPGQPRGTNIKLLKWDDNLAESAQLVADTCIFKHIRVRDERWRFPVGQNLGGGQRSEYVSNSANWTAIIESWFNESKKYKYAKIGLDYQRSGDYTQLIWADTEYVGCGFNSHSNGDEDSDYEVEEMYVCHYGPR